MAEQTSISDILLKRFHALLTDHEQQALDEWLHQSGHNRAFFDEINNERRLRELILSFRDQERESSQARLQKRLTGQLFPERAARPIHFLKTTWFRYAAILLLIAGTAALVYQINLPQQEITQKKTILQPADIQPGGNKALLTLSDGRIIVLDSAANGAVAQQGNTKIIKLDGGALAYQGKVDGGPVMYNTISTPKGGLYQVVLPDGTKVWLNAASSLRFPTTFDKDRRVTVTGEAYLEVIPDKIKPFLVEVGGTWIEVLGTSFNVNAYKDESVVKIALLEGSVKIATAFLKPGQAYINGQVVATDIQQDLSWKNGMFQFKGATVQEVMRQVSRWYDIEVNFEGKIPPLTFDGEMPRSVPLNTVLKGLQFMEVHFRLEGKKLTVTP